MVAKECRCRNCGSSDRYSKEVNARGGYGPDLLPIGFWSRARFEIQVCGNCGLVEWFVPSRLLSKVKERFDRVSA
jgi:predicted nucleic-acid-binding Zn-ribbon protein